MKTYLSDKKKSNSVTVFIFCFIIVFSVIFYFFGDKLSGAVSDFISRKMTILNASDLQQLSAENNKLKNENQELKILLKNSAVSEDFINKGIVDLVEASILLSKTSLIYSNLLINKGEEDGIKNSSLVFIGGLTPVGRIIEVNKNSSIVEMFSKSGNKIDVVYGTSTEFVNFTAYGDGSYGFYASVPYVLDIHFGDEVFLKENTNYIFGKVVDMVQNINNKTKEIYIKNDFNPMSVNKLYVER
jgi:cell shape-determining protein MreC